MASRVTETDARAIDRRTTAVADGAARSTTRLRIALVAPPLLPVPPQRYAGTERVVAALAAGLSGRGHDVTLFASGDSAPGCRVVPVLPQAVWTRGFRADAGIFLALSAAVAARQAADFDLVHLHLDAMGLSLQQQLPVPSLTTFHGRLDQEGTFEMVEHYREVPMVAISASQRRWHPTANWLGVVHHGLALADAPASAVVGGYLAVVGRACAEKGIAESIEVARRTGQRLQIAAKAHDHDELAFVERVIAPALDTNVRFLGEVDAGVRDALLRDARATLMLGGWPEPFGLVAIESLATGTPVIARRAGALPEIIEHGVDGFLVDDVEEAVLAVRLVGDLDRRRIRERALLRFGRDRMVEDYLRIYAALLAGHDPLEVSAPARVGLRSRDQSRVERSPVVASWPVHETADQVA